MAIQLIGKDPNTPNNGSPTIWRDDDGSLIIQSYLIDDDATMDVVGQTGPVPDYEGVVRLPERMIPLLRQAIGD
jgi:hypothetical protein